MKRTLHLKSKPLVFVLLLIACLILLTSCDASNKGSASPGPTPNETQVSSPSTSVLPTKTPTSEPPTNIPPPTRVPTSVPPTSTSSTTSPPSLCPINSSSLSFISTIGQDPPAQEVTIANCGGPGHWTASTSTSDGAHWLSTNPSEGWLDSGASQKVSIAIASANLPGADYTGQVSFTLGSTSVIVSNVTLAALPCIQVNPGSLTFTATQGQRDPAAQSVTITNCYSDALWTASTANGSSWLALSPTGGTLKAGASQSVTVSPTISGLSAGTYMDVITFTLTTTSMTTEQMVAVTLTVQPPPAPTPCIRANTASLSFTATQGQGDPAAQLVTLTNCGSAYSWSGTISTADGGTWLNFSPINGTLNEGGMQPVTIAVSIAGLISGTYTDTITFTSGTSTAMVSVTMTVQPAPS